MCDCWSFVAVALAVPNPGPRARYCAETTKIGSALCEGHCGMENCAMKWPVLAKMLASDLWDDEVRLRVAKVKYCASFLLVRKLWQLHAARHALWDSARNRTEAKTPCEDAAGVGLLRLSDDVLVVRILHQAMTPLQPALFARLCLVNPLLTDRCLLMTRPCNRCAVEPQCYAVWVPQSSSGQITAACCR